MNRRTALKTLSMATVGLLVPTFSEANIPISVGRQLFVDDHLIAHLNGLTRVWNTPQLWPTPLIVPDRPWEEIHINGGFAMPFSDGIIWDGQQFRCYYMAGLFEQRSTCLAYSTDGVNWTKPTLADGTNRVVIHNDSQQHNGWRDSQSVIYDPSDPNPEFRWKMFTFSPGGGQRTGWIRTSPDGITWTFRAHTFPCGDRSTVYKDPFRNWWVYSIRNDTAPWGRHRQINISQNPLPEVWNPQFWCAADAQDYVGTENPQLYNLDCAPYESLMVGLFSIFHGDRPDAPKLCDISLGFNRDGVSWTRSPQRPFIAMGSQGSWNYGNVQSCGSIITLGDHTGIYFSGRQGTGVNSAHGRSSMGLAYMRRDGFASLNGTGSLVTKPMLFTGRHLFINGNVTNLIVDILSPDEQTTYVSSYPLTVDGTKVKVNFPIADLGAGINVPLKFRFTYSGQLFSFWLSPTTLGQSNGFINGPE